MIDYCKQILGKSIRDLTIEDLKVYFSEVREESEILEFKSGKGDFEGIFNKNILRTVSAFLNSSGGVLIWGSPEDKAPEKGMPKVCVGDLVPVNERKEKDQLINRIASSISYMPTGIKVERIDIENGYAYVIEVQESESKPHQLNGQYLIRLDGQSKPAPHYIVDSMFNQIKYPKLDGRIKFKTVRIHNKILVIEVDVLIFNKSPFINEKNLSFQLVVSNGIIMERNHWQYFSKDHKILHFGRPYAESHVLRFDNYNANEKIKIVLSFGGELAPALANNYEIDTRNMVDGDFKFNEYVMSCNENISYKSIQENLGKTHEENINKHLNRS